MDYSIRTVKSVSIRVPKTFVLESDSCSKKKSVFIHPCDKNIRVIRAIRVQKNPCLSVSIRVPKIFDSCSKKIRVQKSSPPKSHTPMQNPGGPPLSYLACPETTIPISRHDHYHYLFTSLHNLLAIHNIHTMRQAADTGTCSDTSAVKGIDACGRTVVCRLCTDAFYSCTRTI